MYNLFGCAIYNVRIDIYLRLFDFLYYDILGFADIFGEYCLLIDLFLEYITYFVSGRDTDCTVLTEINRGPTLLNVTSPSISLHNAESGF